MGTTIGVQSVTPVKNFVLSKLTNFETLTVLIKHSFRIQLTWTHDNITLVLVFYPDLLIKRNLNKTLQYNTRIICGGLIFISLAIFQ